MSIKLDKHQLLAIEKLRTGSVLYGGVGSGKSRAALAYYYTKVCGGTLKINGNGQFTAMATPIDLYIITTARKRDTLEWEGECAPFLLSTNKKLKLSNVNVIVDSWHNIKKYVNVNNAFFIFDEQRVVGSGVWVKSFLKIVKKNKWILLTATPGDTWMDYIPLFIANGFYKNRTEFIRRHVVYNSFVKFPMVERYLDTGHLIKLRKKILVNMKYRKRTISHDIIIPVGYDKKQYDILLKKRWNIFKERPIKNISELCYALRRVTNTDISRKKALKDISNKHEKLIIFYNFNYELYILKEIANEISFPIAEWNGHRHEPLPKTNKWLYLVQYSANAEGWNCIETNAMVFFSQNYSYKTKVQAAGRIDRRNTPFTDLYYYTFISNASIDRAIKETLKNKKNFNEKDFIKK